MNEKTVYLTKEGLEKLKVELDELINVKRPALAQRLAFAIKQGDLSENADYIQAKEEQGFLEGRILDVQAMLRNAEVIVENTANDGIVRMGGHVTVVEDGWEPESYIIVGSAEANPGAGRISNESPLGKALMGHKVGQKVAFETPGGSAEVEILSIE